MSIPEFIAAMPKAELNLHLTGAFRKQSLLMIAKQNGIPAAIDDFDAWLSLLDQPDFARSDEIARALGRWVMYPKISRSRSTISASRFPNRMYLMPRSRSSRMTSSAAQK